MGDKVDNIFSNAISSIANKFGKTELDEDTVMMAIPVPSFSFRFLMQNDGLLTGRVVHLLGKEASFKSTLSLEILRWHGLLGGGGFILDTESRPIADTQKALLNFMRDRYVALPCSSLEEWQAMLIHAVKELKSADEKNKKPACFIVDSLLGCNSEDANKNIESQGYASTRWAVEARSIADYLRSFNRLLYHEPFTVCFVNHRKLRAPSNPYGQPVKAALGGGEVQFYTSLELELTNIGKAQTFSSVASYEVLMKSYKNTHGQVGIEIRCPVRFFTKDDELKVVFDWHTTTARMLSKAWGIKPTVTPTTMKKVGEICKVNTKSAGPHGERFWSDELGIPKTDAVTGKELGLALEEHPDILDELYKVFRIHKRYLYNKNLTFIENVNAAKQFNKDARMKSDMSAGTDTKIFAESPSKDNNATLEEKGETK